MKQLTGQNRFRSSGGYKRMAVVYASYSLRTREAIKESVVCDLTELAVERIEDDESMGMPNEFHKKQCHV